jgi:sigma-E factor negative regulatory protein RseC
VREEGIVVQSHGDRATVRVERSAACRHCSARALCRPFGDTANIMTVANTGGASPGQRVAVAIEPERLVKNSLVLYGIPLLAVVAGAVAGAYIGRAWIGTAAMDIGAILGAVACLAMAVIVIYILDRTASKGVESLPQIIEILDQ